MEGKLRKRGETANRKTKKRGGTVEKHVTHPGTLWLLLPNGILPPVVAPRTEGPTAYRAKLSAAAGPTAPLAATRTSCLRAVWRWTRNGADLCL